MLSIDLIFGGALYDIYDPSSCLYPLLRSEKDLKRFVQLHLSQKARWRISLHKHKTSQSPTKSNNAQ